MNGTPVGKQEKRQLHVPVLLINGYQEIEAVQNDPIEPLYQAVGLRMQTVVLVLSMARISHSLLQAAESKFLP
ncbi:hypothetical protein TNCV_3121071 [Trichonephila clavipes]|nr:hypothetical protein TNCV_3121071 [Trichonephila clavipes]